MPLFLRKGKREKVRKAQWLLRQLRSEKKAYVCVKKQVSLHGQEMRKGQKIAGRGTPDNTQEA